MNPSAYQRPNRIMLRRALFLLTVCGIVAFIVLGMQRRASETENASRSEDNATVLGIRRGQGFTHFCRTIIDKVGEYLH